MKYRTYNPKKDRAAVQRIALEVGWSQKENAKPFDMLVGSGRAIVAEVNGAAESLVVSHRAEMKYLDEMLTFSGIAAVSTGLVARRLHLAQRLTAVKIAQDVDKGTAVSGLGMFDQGFYNKLGFGTGSYEHITRFAPATLNVKVTPRVPSRLDKRHWQKIHASRTNRLRCHGACNLHAAAMTRAELHWTKGGFGLGYFDKQGRLTHHLWMSGLGQENGPIFVRWMTYRNYDQFLELMALIRSFGDQIPLVTMIEPPNVRLQDLLTRPFFHRRITDHSDYQNIMRASAYWQVRVCDLRACLAKTHLPGKAVRFNLTLHDPIEAYLDPKPKWRGLTGDYVITLGLRSSAKRGTVKGLPRMDASVGAFSRMWLGVASASGVAATDRLSAPPTLLEKLDTLVRLPKPSLDWDF